MAFLRATFSVRDSFSADFFAVVEVIVDDKKQEVLVEENNEVHDNIDNLKGKYLVQYTPEEIKKRGVASKYVV